MWLSIKNRRGQVDQHGLWNLWFGIAMVLGQAVGIRDLVGMTRDKMNARLKQKYYRI